MRETRQIKDQVMTNRELQIPSSIRFADIEGGMLITYNWFKAKYLVALVLTPVFCYFLVHSDYVSGDLKEVTFPFVIISVVALLIMYYSVARILNTTRMRISNDRIVVRTGPLPFAGNRTLAREEVVQLYVTRRAVGHRYYLTVTTYQVIVQLLDGSEVTLIRGLTSAAQGWFIEKKIESFFKIKDIPVKGEVDKS